MARSTRLNGPSLTPEESADPDSPQPVRVRRAELGIVDQPIVEETEEESSADGGHSIHSSEKGQTSSGKPSPARRKPAPVTGSHLRQQPQGTAVDAHSVAGSTHKMGTESSKARSRSTADPDDDFDEFK